MRTIATFALMIAALAAKAETPALQLDSSLVADVERVLVEHTAASANLPGMLDVMESAPAASGSSGGGGSSGALAGIGFGLQIGTPTALTFKFGAPGNADIVLGIGAGIAFRGDPFGLSLHGDYLLTLAPLLHNGTINLDFYMGPGLWIVLFNAGSFAFFNGYIVATNFNLFGIGARLPIGLNLRFTTAPVEFYLELDPALFAFPAVGFFVGSALGFRWFF